jgi:hypothetical protein
MQGGASLVLLSLANWQAILFGVAHPMRGGVSVSNHAAMVAIHAVHYNFARIHKTLRITPAMAAGHPITSGRWKKSLGLP